MKTIYKTSYSPWFIVPVSLIIIATLLLSLMDYAVLGAAIIALCGIYFVYVFANLRYLIDNNVLQVTCGALSSTKINISEIRKVTETFSILNQPAGAFRRLEIIYKKFESIEISPKEKGKFIAQLKALNPEIEFHHKN